MDVDYIGKSKGKGKSKSKSKQQAESDHPSIPEHEQDVDRE